MATAALLADTVDRTANYYTGSDLTASGTKEKHMTEAIEAIRANRTKPLSEDKDLEDALYRNLCTTQIVSRTSRGSMTRSRCEDVELVETLICIIPSEIPADPELDDLPHPDIKNAFISQRGDDFLRELWIFNANPFHDTQPVQGRRTNGGFKIIN